MTVGQQIYHPGRGTHGYRFYGKDAIRDGSVGKQILIIKPLKNFSPDEASGKWLMTKDDIKPNKVQQTGKRASPGSSAINSNRSRFNGGGAAASSGNGSPSVCVMSGAPGHFSSKCNLINQPDKWVELSARPDRVHGMATTVRSSIRSDLLAVSETKVRSDTTHCPGPLTALYYNYAWVLSFRQFS